MRPAIDALERHHQVFTFSLGEASGPGLFDAWTARIDRLLDEAGHRRAAVAGVSFGGLVAVWYAAQRPERVSRLILVSAPAPTWRLDAEQTRYLRHPRLSLPIFAARGLQRLAPEVVTALPGLVPCLRFGAAYGVRALRFPASAVQIANFVNEWARTDVASAVGRVSAPTLVITGEDGLDRVVPVSSTREYLRLIRGATYAKLAGTGHVGFVSKPREFAAIVTDFVHAS